jgi:hypothetical protein
LPKQPTVSPKPPPPDRSGRHQKSAIARANSADPYAAALAAGTLPNSRNSSRISFYPFGSRQAYYPIPETDWIAKVEAALDKINRNEVGRAVLRNITKNVIIYPYLSWAKNATTSTFSDKAWTQVMINPKRWDGLFEPGCSADEILLHELVHVIENVQGGYENRWGFMFDDKDFLTINATNVYSCMLGQALRKDHHGYMPLPDEHFSNPQLHYEQQRPNYGLAVRRLPGFVGVLQSVRGFWNPFSYCNLYPYGAPHPI